MVNMPILLYCSFFKWCVARG